MIECAVDKLSQELGGLLDNRHHAILLMALRNEIRPIDFPKFRGWLVWQPFQTV